MDVLWTTHAKERQKEWERKLGITEKEVDAVINKPDQIVSGDRDSLVAQSRRGSGLLRVAFSEVSGKRKILTVYWTSKVEKYWKI